MMATRTPNKQQDQQRQRESPQDRPYNEVSPSQNMVHTPSPRKLRSFQQIANTSSSTTPSIKDVSTPTRSKLAFMSYCDRIPENLKRLELNATLRSKDHLMEVSSLEDRLSAFEANLAKERLECQKQSEEIGRRMRSRIKSSADTLVNCTSTSLNISKCALLEDKVSDMEHSCARFVRNSDITMSKKFDQTIEPSVRELEEALKVEQAKASRESGVLTKRYENYVGDSKCCIDREHAAMTADLTLFRTQTFTNDNVDSTEEKKDDKHYPSRKIDHKKLRDLLREVVALRSLVETEYQERENCDSDVIDHFLHQQQNIQAFLLQVVTNADKIEGS